MQCIPRENFHTHPLLNRLFELHSVPEKIYIEGSLPDVTLDEYGRSLPRILTIVGSRSNTPYGAAVIHKLVDALKDYPVVIISGLAYGIDSLAHTQALENNLTTLAVLGNGLTKEVMYPASHYGLSQDIVRQGGALISELSPDTRAAKWTFPARNRIVAAMSDAILLVETQEKSGTLITARLGLELGRDIGAVPGSIFEPMSRGTNNLLRDGASPITSIEDLLELLHLSPREDAPPATMPDDLSPEEKIILNLLDHPCSIDQITATSALPPEVILQTLTRLDMKGYIHEQFGEVRRIV